MRKSRVPPVVSLNGCTGVFRAGDKMRVFPIATAIICLFSISCWNSLAEASDAPNTPPPGASAGDLGLEPLVDDLSRQDLFAEVTAASINENGEVSGADISWFSLWGPFRFPNDVDFDVALQKPRSNSIFGVDISHYTPLSFPLENLRQKKVRFVYMKATQGTRYVDDHFAQFWARAGNLPQGSEVHRGAYHFLSAGDSAVDPHDWGVAQGKTFVKVILANKGLKKTDLPPVVDLEWDKASLDGPDRWAGRTPDQIIEIIQGFMGQVKSDLGVTPVIYTARAWWNERIRSEALVEKLKDYLLWGADYSRKSRASEEPKTINGHAWALWQFTSGATMAIGFSKAFDANVFEGDEDSFYKLFKTERFQ